MAQSSEGLEPPKQKDPGAQAAQPPVLKEKNEPAAHDGGLEGRGAPDMEGAEGRGVPVREGAVPLVGEALGARHWAEEVEPMPEVVVPPGHGCS